MKGPRLLSVVAAAIAVMCTVLVLVADSRAHAAHLVIRWTGRTSLVLFLLAYIARPATQLRPRAFTKHLLAQRTWIGLGFFTSHAFHLVAILVLAAPDLGAFARAQDPTIIVALVAYVLLFAMAITSNTKIRKAMPPRQWKRLHRIGMHLFWIVFATTYGTAIAASPVFVVPALGLVLAGAVRLAAYRRGAKQGRAMRAATGT